jgi:hypothetical protein
MNSETINSIRTNTNCIFFVAAAGELSTPRRAVERSPSNAAKPGNKASQPPALSVPIIQVDSQ